MNRELKKISQKLVQKLIVPSMKSALFNRQNQIMLSLKYKEFIAHGEKLSFDEVGFDVYSVTHEDGIFLYIFSVIGTTNKKCIDIGAASIVGSSVANLIVHQGFEALLMDGDAKSLGVAREYYQTGLNGYINEPVIVASIVTAENINGLIVNHGFAGAIDLLCIDIDGIDYWVWKAIDTIQPRVVMVEYQDLLGPDLAWVIPYNPKFSIHDYAVNKETNNYCGASLQAFVNLAREKGYRLIGCNNSGWNAFFLKNGIGEDVFPELPAQECFKTVWNKYSIEKRFPLIKDMPWEKV